MFSPTGKVFDIEEIISEMDKNNYDIVVMSARGHGALADAVLGSASRRVIRRCSKPVLLVRLPKSE